MELIMQIDGKVLDAIKVHVPTSQDDQYLNWLKCGLRRKHEQIIHQWGAEPKFYLHIKTEN